MNIDGLSFTVGMIIGASIMTVIVFCIFIYIKDNKEDRK